MNDFGLLVGKYLSTLPTLLDTQLNELQLDAKGRLIISGRYFEDDGHTSGDAGIFAMGVRNDNAGQIGVAASVLYSTVTFTATNTGTLGNSISLVFNGTDDVATVVGAWNATNPTNTVGYTGLGTYVPGAGTANLIGGLNDTTLTSANLDYSPIAVDKFGRLQVLADLDVDFDYVYAEDAPAANGDLGTYVLAVRQDTLGSSTSNDGDFASFKVNAKGELYVIDTDVKSLLTNLSKADGAAHGSGDKGIMSLAVRRDADSSLVGTDGNYAPLQVDSIGRLKVIADLDAQGTASYIVTDALAAGGDGLEVITAALTPWVTVASMNLTTGKAYIYGWQWACDQNASSRLITDDSVNIATYKVGLNSSAEPERSEHFSESGRIEIVGASNLVIKLQIKKRNTTGGNANGTGSVHIRTV